MAQCYARGVEQPDTILETDRLRLRPYRVDDADALFEILGDPHTMRFYPQRFTREDADAWIQRQLDRYERDGFGLWAMELRTTGEFIGNCGPAVQEVEGQREVELGWHVHRRHWGQGLATEAAAACREHAFERLGVDRLIALVRPENRPSARVAEKIGMRVERTAEFRGLPHLVYVTLRPRAARHSRAAGVP